MIRRPLEMCVVGSKAAVCALLSMLPVFCWGYGCGIELGGGPDPTPSGSPGAGLACVECHTSPQGPRRAITDAEGTRGHSLWGLPQENSSCEACHEMTQHQQGRVRIWNSPLNPTSVVVLEGDPATDPAEADKLVPFCGACHGEANYITHAVVGRWRPSCPTCHDLHDPDGTNLSMITALVRNQTLDQDKPVALTASHGPGSFSDGDPASRDGICQVCHTATAYHRHDGGGLPHNEGADCTTCHPHASGFLPSGQTSCVGCHSTPRGPRPAVVGPDGSGGHHFGSYSSTDDDCSVCHDTSQHRQGQVRLWQDPAVRSSTIIVTGDPAQLEQFCVACHQGADHPTVHTTGASWQPTCLECHQIHDPANLNLALVANAVHNQTLDVDQTVLFTARTGSGSFSDGAGANDGICQVCHTTTSHHRHDGGGTAHNEGADCTGCHLHSAGFTLAGGTFCTGCHDTAQGQRRPIVDEFGLASHHVQGRAVTDEDCVVCHEMSEHQHGRVRLKNVDDPTNPAAVVVLDGDPSSDQAEAVKLEPFCLACHDNDGAGGAVPFSAGVFPTPIDASLWSAAAHQAGGAAGPVTCFGNGDGFGCHDTGHGSAKRKMLAPADGSQPPIPGDPLREEEGLCFSCHDADGPASTDLQAQFALATHHNVSALDQADGSRLECTDCHNPHTANSAALLVNPDSGDPFSGTKAQFCLTCHDGAPPPGVAFPGTSFGTGYDKSTFTGSTHADELGAESCGHCHQDHGSRHRSMLRDQYAVADDTAYSATDYALCWTCHDSAATVDGDNAFEDYHHKHVDGEDAPCIICHDVHAPTDPGEAGLINFEFAIQGGYDIELRNRFGTYTPSQAFTIDTTPPEMGICNLTCHSEEHAPKNYDRAPDPLVDCSACHPASPYQPPNPPDSPTGLRRSDPPRT